ncbi:MAG: putative DNA binding domain-containing protein [Chlamydiae bacterium]|nr:putative DNA binding domain-containing protein [Chlamydiota bacterium]MBI3276191.1 putative DNA binding domain-containing protein [Chlamydiota bacterium]
MTAIDRKVLKWIRQGESEAVEFKESFGREALETICAFSNTAGGTLLIGVSNSGQIMDLQVGQQLLKDWANQISQGLGLHPSIDLYKVKSKSVVRISVLESRMKPMMFHGKAYRRFGSTTRHMNLEKLTRVALENVGITWDEIIEPRASMSDISMVKVKAFFRLAKEMGRRPVPDKVSSMELLEKLELVRVGKPTRAAILLFGKNPQKFYIHAIVKIGRFRNETLIVDDREIEGTLFDQVEGATGYFREKLETRFEMTGQPQRNVIWEYPLDALREALINAVCHRDYLSGGHTEVRLYDQELMVWNPGGLPTGISLAMLKGRHTSVPRNRLIAKIFFYAGLIEQWGSGIQKMVGACRTVGLPEPKFEELMGFRITFAKSPFREGEKVRHKEGDFSTPQVPPKYPPSINY